MLETKRCHEALIMRPHSNTFVAKVIQSIKIFQKKSILQGGDDGKTTEKDLKNTIWCAK
jgi:hypothetical protein